ncbi:MAG: ATP-binding cassette domain-containing protein [Oscillospiraceae bacterium]|nr:ATP-binding cassette domain-containing protein [Oscillospiraceae bacterium]
MAEKVLSVKNLITAFRIDKKEYPVLRDISFDIYENETVCMVGESGCGKSVTTLSVMGLLPENAVMQQGEIELCGEVISGKSQK